MSAETENELSGIELGDGVRVVSRTRKRDGQIEHEIGLERQIGTRRSPVRFEESDPNPTSRSRESQDQGFIDRMVEKTR